MKISFFNFFRCGSLFRGILVSTLSAFLLSGFLGAACAETATPSDRQPQASRLPDFTELVERVGPAVVNIRTTEKAARIDYGTDEDQELQEFLYRFFGLPVPEVDSEGRREQGSIPDRQSIRRGIGSGFIISPDGYILTNAHVVEGADEVYIRLVDKREFKARIVGVDKRTDVGVVKIDGADLPYLKLGLSRNVRAGEWVIAIGSPFDLDNTVTAGIVSAKARDTGDYLPLIQTDVAVNPGNSGGPLINMRGEVIGITSQIYSRSGGYMGISFAIPIDEAIQVSEQLKTTGRVIRGRIGVQIGEISSEVAKLLGLQKKEGALVQRVEPGGPADKGGLQAGDIILGLNGSPIERFTDLPRQVGSSKPGSQIKLLVWRKGADREIVITVAESPSDKTAKLSGMKKKGGKKTDDAAGRILGLSVSDLSDSQKSQSQTEGGVVVTTVEGASAQAGLKPGDVILRVNNSDVKNARQFESLASRLDASRTILLLVRRGETFQFVPIRPNVAR